MRKNLVAYVLLTAGAAVVAFPFIWMLGTAFKSAREAAQPSIVFWPQAIQWGNVAAVFHAAPFGMYFANTFAVAAAVTLGVVATSLLAGYAFARLRFPGRNALFAVVLASMMIPFEVALIPNFVIVSRLGWYNTYAALTVPWLANAFSLFLVRQAFLSLPRDYRDAAMIDGCGHMQFLVWIGAPLIKATLITVALFAFLGSYNALLWPLVVTGTDNMRVVQVGLTVFSNAEIERVDLLMCASAIVILPTVAIYFAAQRSFVTGAYGAGIKG